MPHYYLHLVEQSEAHLWGGAQAQALDRLEQEHDNLRLALAWHIAHEEGIEPALRMAGLLWRFWSMRGHWTEGRQWLEQALSRRASAALAHRWIALHGAGNLSLDLGQYTRAKAYYEESLAVTQQLNHQRGVANSLLNLSMVAFYQGELDRCAQLAGTGAGDSPRVGQPHWHSIGDPQPREYPRANRRLRSRNRLCRGEPGALPGSGR